MLSATLFGWLYVPAAGLKVGGTACSVYVALDTVLLTIPLAALIALTVVVLVSEIGPE